MSTFSLVFFLSWMLVYTVKWRMLNCECSTGWQTRWSHLGFDWPHFTSASETLVLHLCSQCAHYTAQPPARPCDLGVVIRATICDDPRISCQAEYQKPGPDTGRTCGAVNSTGLVPVHRFGNTGRAVAPDTQWRACALA